MTSTRDSHKAARFFQQQLGAEVDWKRFHASKEDIHAMPFPLYKTNQKIGDLVLVPRESLHQVTNRGGLTIKIAWSRMTLNSLHDALHHELPVYQR